MRLIYIQPEGNAGEVPQMFPDIYIGTDAVTVGKTAGSVRGAAECFDRQPDPRTDGIPEGDRLYPRPEQPERYLLKWRTFRAAGAAHLYRRSADCLCRCSVPGGSCAYTVLSVANIRFDRKFFFTLGRLGFCTEPVSIQVFKSKRMIKETLHKHCPARPEDRHECFPFSVLRSESCCRWRGRNACVGSWHRRRCIEPDVSRSRMPRPEATIRPSISMLATMVSLEWP